MEKRPTQIIFPQQGEKHTHACILLHGLGSDTAEFTQDFFKSQASDKRELPTIFPTMKWVMPSSRLHDNSGFDQKNQSQWFDIW
jgi:predicted esterase